MFGLQNAQFQRRLVQYHQGLYYLAYSWCNNHAIAQDITQEAMEKALRKRHQLSDPDSIKPWLATILSNCWKDYLRRQKIFEDSDSLEFIDNFTPEHDLARDEICLKVRQGISRLPSKQRMVITLVDIFELRYAEVADILEIPTGTVMSRLSRARAALKDSLIDYKGHIENSISPSNWRNKS